MKAQGFVGAFSEKRGIRPPSACVGICFVDASAWSRCCSISPTN